MPSNGEPLSQLLTAQGPVHSIWIDLKNPSYGVFGISQLKCLPYLYHPARIFAASPTTHPLFGIPALGNTRKITAAFAIRSVGLGGLPCSFRHSIETMAPVFPDRNCPAEKDSFRRGSADRHPGNEIHDEARLTVSGFRNCLEQSASESLAPFSTGRLLCTRTSLSPRENHARAIPVIRRPFAYAERTNAYPPSGALQLPKSHLLAPP
ncbi:hypothetical protein SAMN06265222_109206 [Neorhodopirellula lusitana]|uniref:Uncharacterized protein n=1 Tax=Neorhodopirellula lusitana TaxID=445327 RepID=A0ABY1QB51_9BACT|nr:hypothetical protein SAMN06265222_109206 [Neorhodopirellula lusitana]